MDETTDSRETPALHLKLRSSQPARKQTPLWQRPLPVILAITISVSASCIYIAGNAYIAKTDLRRQVLEQEMAQLARIRVENCLTINRLTSADRHARQSRPARGRAQAEGTPPGAGRLSR